MQGLDGGRLQGSKEEMAALLCKLSDEDAFWCLSRVSAVRQNIFCSVIASNTELLRMLQTDVQAQNAWTHEMEGYSSTPLFVASRAATGGLPQEGLCCRFLVPVTSLCSVANLA